MSAPSRSRDVLNDDVYWIAFTEPVPWELLQRKPTESPCIRILRNNNLQLVLLPHKHQNHAHPTHDRTLRERIDERASHFVDNLAVVRIVQIENTFDDRKFSGGGVQTAKR